MALRIGGARLPTVEVAHPFHRCPAAARKRARHAVFHPIGENQAIPGHGAHEMMELGFDGIEIGENIRMIEFDVVDDQRARTVVDELRALVEKCGVVFVGLDHEERRLAQPRR